MEEAFKNVRLSQNIEVNAIGGPGFNTSIIETVSGDEYRNINWSRQRGSWEIGYIDEHKDIEEIIAFFQVMRGRAYGFRFKDWSDYKVNNIIAIGDGLKKDFQVLKNYTVGEHFYSRILTRLVDPVIVTVDGNTVTPIVDINTGIITFLSAPDAGAEIHVTGEFDVPVRFNIDNLPITMLSEDVSKLDSVPIIEIRDHGNS